MAKNDDLIDPPNNFVVEDFHKPLLYTADGTPLRRQIGFAMAQTSGTCPPLSDNVSKRKPKKGK